MRRRPLLTIAAVGAVAGANRRARAATMELNRVKAQQDAQQRAQQQAMAGYPPGMPPPPPGYYYPPPGMSPPPPGYYYPQAGQAPPPPPPGYYYPQLGQTPPPQAAPVQALTPQQVPPHTPATPVEQSSVQPAAASPAAPQTPQAAAPEPAPAAAAAATAGVAVAMGVAAAPSVAQANVVNTGSTEASPPPPAAPAAVPAPAPVPAQPAQGQPAYGPPVMYGYAPIPVPMMTPVNHPVPAPRTPSQQFTPKHALGHTRPSRLAPRPPTEVVTRRPSGEIVFYTHPLAFNPSKVAIMLVEKRLPFRTVEVDILTGGNLEPKYMKLNSKGQVPTIVVDGKIMTESLCICEYLDGIEGQYLGGNVVDRAFIKEFSQAIDKFNGNLWAFGHSSQKLLNKLSKVDIYRKNYAAKQLKLYPELRTAYSDKIKTMSANLDGAQDPDEVAAMDLYLEQLLDRAEERLTPVNTSTSSVLFLAGPEFSMVDALFAPILFRINVLGMSDNLLRPRPRLANYFARIRVRPSYQTAFEDAPDKWGGGSALRRAMMKIKARSMFSWL